MAVQISNRKLLVVLLAFLVVGAWAHTSGLLGFGGIAVNVLLGAFGVALLFPNARTRLWGVIGRPVPLKAPIVAALTILLLSGSGMLGSFAAVERAAQERAAEVQREAEQTRAFETALARARELSDGQDAIGAVQEYTKAERLGILPPEDVIRFGKALVSLAGAQESEEKLDEAASILRRAKSKIPDDPAIEAALTRVSTAAKARAEERAKEHLALQEACVDDAIRQAKEFARKADRIAAKPADLAKAARDLETLATDLAKEIENAKQCAKEAAKVDGTGQVGRDTDDKIAALHADRERIAARAAKAEADRKAERFAKLAKELGSIGAGRALIVRVEQDARDTNTAKITVSNAWHGRPHQIRLQDAQALWKVWSQINYPVKPDHTRLKLVDLMGNEVGGSRVLGGSMIWVKD